MEQGIDRADAQHDARHGKLIGEFKHTIAFGGVTDVPVTVDFSADSPHIDDISELTVSLAYLDAGGHRDFLDVWEYLTQAQRDEINQRVVDEAKRWV